MSSRIACSPLTGEIHIGRVNKQGTAFTGGKRNVTSDVLGAVIGKAEYHGGTFEVRGSNGEVWDVTVTKRPAQAAAQGGAA